MPMSDTARFDALLPAEMATKAEAVGVRKAGMSATRTLVLAVLGGAFIALGAAFATTVATSPGLPFGLGRLLAGLSFSLGLTLVVVGGAELFTGNALLVMAWASGKITSRALLRNWGLVLLGNAVGAIGTAALVALAEHHRHGDGQVGLTMLRLAASKQALAPGPAIALGVLGNALVCLAVWMSLSARGLADRVLAVVGPVTAFVACGFEHSIANLYFGPVALLTRALAPSAELARIEQLGQPLAGGAGPTQGPAWADLSWTEFLAGNVAPVTVGNVLGGGVLVALVYWFVYLRPARSPGS